MSAVEDMIPFYDKEIKEAQESVKYWKNKKQEYIKRLEKQNACIHDWVDVPARRRDMNCWDHGADAYTKCSICGKRKE